MRQAYCHGPSKIVNSQEARIKKYRIRILVGVAYGSDIDLVRGVLMDVADNNEAVCNNPKARMRFRFFGNSSLNFELLCWVQEPALRDSVIDILLTDIYKHFNRENIETPFSKQDPYFKEMPGSGPGLENNGFRDV